MRLVKVTVPAGMGETIVKTAFAAGIDGASVQSSIKHMPSGQTSMQDEVNIETSTPTAKKFVAAVLGTDYFDKETVSINVRQPRTLLSGTSVRELTRPLAEPSTDLYQEFWQFTHITYGLVGRVAIGSGILALGLIRQQLLLIIAGLFFLPLLPMIMAAGFGLLSGSIRLLMHAVSALGLSLLLIVGSSALVAALSSPPLKYDDFLPWSVSVLLSLGVGVAAGFAAIDDSGKRELIGLAAAAQVAIIPAWIGSALVLGAPVGDESSIYLEKAGSLVINLAALTAGSIAVFAGSRITAFPAAKIE